MEPWPIVAWVLLLTSMADWLKMAQTRDFTIKDIVALHPSTTPHPGGFKCFTCQDAADNYECNRWAPDTYCPKGTSYCYTLHVMDIVGDSVSVTKRCVALEDCLLTGCTNTTEHGYQVFCTSCCEGTICNLRAPFDQRSAVFSTSSPLVVVSSSWRSTATTRLFPETLCYVVIGVIAARHA